MIRTRCPCCKGKLLPKQRIHPECIDAWATEQQAKAARKAQREARARAKVDRATDRSRRMALETIPQLKAAAQVAVNRYARLRDMARGYGCISCGRKPEQCFGGAMDAGHYRSVGAAPHLRYYLPQIALQCVYCNRDLSGNIVEFRKGLVERRGPARVEQIECINGTAKWSRDYLRRLKTVMAKKAKRLEKRHAMQG